MLPNKFLAIVVTNSKFLLIISVILKLKDAKSIMPKENAPVVIKDKC